MNTTDKNVHVTKEYIDTAGHKSGMFIESTDFNNPVLLFVHGGPGFPQYANVKQEGLAWANHFTVCYWEQRGTGMSYNASTQGEITLERIVADGLVIVNHLKRKFNQDKIYLCGHSWGSLVASIMASRRPEQFKAYIGIGQLGRHYESNRDTYDFLLETAIERTDEKAEKHIRSVKFNKEYYKSQEYRKLLGRYLNKYGGGTKREGYSSWQGVKDIIACKQYSWNDRLNILKGMFASYNALGETLANADAAEMAPSFDVPVYIVHGVYDYQTSYKEAKRFYERIEAPSKQMYTFEHSAHSPFVEEQERFMEVLVEVLN
ncbi:alpha/beta fold hydrolase [Oceanobacillus sp. 1P07AA]|uniref:alpha/beta fold hydrolase n=1 Tax=Oceanobacillus sp. 1P07AA TaxID=3132293 RepID=UPI0039A6F6A6